MSYFEVLFPVNLGPLTYKCPDALSEMAVPGMIVSAPLKNTITKGVLLKKSLVLPKGNIKAIKEIHGTSPVLNKALLKLIEWMSDYYIASAGSVAKHTLQNELFSPVKFKKHKINIDFSNKITLSEISDDTVSDVGSSLSHHHYQTFLLHAMSYEDEASIAFKLSALTRNIIVLFPEISMANIFYATVKDLLGDRVCLLHGELSKGMRSEHIAGIADGTHDVVIGTRSALFAPLKTVSLIIVIGEHSTFYKLEEGVRYNLRDVAIMRGFLEKSTVLLSSITPSIDSYFNALSGKYRLLKRTVNTNLPRIRVINMNFEKTMKPGISKSVYDAVKKHISKNDKIIFLINRKGYSTMVSCSECNHFEKCDECSVPLVLHKDKNELECHYCGRTRVIPEVCSRCGSHKIELLGSGTERIQEDITKLFGVDAVRFDSERARSKSEIKKIMQEISAGSSKIVVGTKMMTSRLSSTGKSSLAVVLNIDNYMNFTDFRASEKTFSELRSILELVTTDGEVLIQTRYPLSDILKYLKDDNYASFVKNELVMRKELRYPPYSKLLHIRFSMDPSAGKEFQAMSDCFEDSVECLGPVAVRNKKGAAGYSLLLKSGNRKSLNAAARRILEHFEKSKKMEISIDVDPV